MRRPADVPEFQDATIDIPILDMNHGWANLGHDCIVATLRGLALDLEPALASAELSLRVLSYDVRAAHMIPEAPGRRFRLYLGTGGPGHIDPFMNDGLTSFSQGVRENPGWLSRLFELFDDIKRSPDAALLAVCHTFGLLCMWSGVARPALRGPDKGGKSVGIRRNVLLARTSSPWFERFAAELESDRAFRVIDSRLFDLLLHADRDSEAAPVAFEETTCGEPAVTMVEFARDRDGHMPRILAVNHHPEVRDPLTQLRVLEEKLRRGEVSRNWYDERVRIVRETLMSDEHEAAVRATSHFTWLLPLRFHLVRMIRERASLLGKDVAVKEAQSVDVV